MLSWPGAFCGLPPDPVHQVPHTLPITLFIVLILIPPTHPSLYARPDLIHHHHHLTIHFTRDTRPPWEQGPHFDTCEDPVFDCLKAF